MSKFNRKNVVLKGRIKKVMPVTDTVNRAGGSAYKESAELQLASYLLTSFCNDTYFGTTSDITGPILNLLPSLRNPEVAAQAIVYARNEYGMRSSTHQMTCALAQAMHLAGKSGNEWFRPFVRTAISRVDDITEILACWEALAEKAIPNALKRGLRDAFGKFDAYQLGKYRSENGAISLVDAVRLLHPCPTRRNGVVRVSKSDWMRATGKPEPVEDCELTLDPFTALVYGLLKADTRQSKLVTATPGVKSKSERAELRKEVLIDQIRAGRIGHFELLKNLGGYLRDAPEVIDEAVARLTDPDEIRGSRVMPFRYLDAYRAVETLYKNVEGYRKALLGISQALDVSCGNIKLKGKTLVVVDVSGSMEHPVRASKEDEERARLRGTKALSRKSAGALFGAIAAKAGLADLMVFATDAEYVSYNPADSAISIAEKISALKGCPDDSVWRGLRTHNHGTNFNAIFHRADKKYDRIVIFSDMQGWMGNKTRGWANQFEHLHGDFGAPRESLARYCDTYKSIPWIYSCDLAGYGTLMFPENGSKVITLAGYSEKLFDLMAVAEQEPNVLLERIKAVKLK